MDEKAVECCSLKKVSQLINSDISDETDSVNNIFLRLGFDEKEVRFSPDGRCIWIRDWSPPSEDQTFHYQIREEQLLYLCFRLYHFSESLAEFAADMTEGVSLSNMSIKPQTLFKAGMAATAAGTGDRHGPWRKRCFDPGYAETWIPLGT